MGFEMKEGSWIDGWVGIKSERDGWIEMEKERKVGG